MPKPEKDAPYTGFEQGPIRPPSEARSLLVRVTRNCPWNRCTFCPVYKGADFSLRPVGHVMADIDSVCGHLAEIFRLAQEPSGLTQDGVNGLMERLAPGERPAFAAAINWYTSGMESIFLQDANSLIIKPADLVAILRHLKERFPWVKRITSYARSHSVARISDEDLAAIGGAGLNRIHIGMESGSDAVLSKVKKGVTKAEQVKAGQKVKKAGIELSEYVMPGLGGREQSLENALETADALNLINPDFIRLRTLAVPSSTPLFAELSSGAFTQATEVEVAEEILLFLENLKVTGTVLASDHILNLFEDMEGVLPRDQPAMIATVRRFLALDPEIRTLYQVGRRIGVFRGLSDMKNPDAAARAKAMMERLSITPENVDETINRIMRSFV
ncbi:MAG: radical SAM protein [Deltaproteobacteria bacterium]|nr:radical SAM protein [Deltaproteobacteria bacterium]